VKAVAAAVLLLLAAEAADACECLPPGQPKDELAQADVVFAGTADSVRQLMETTTVLGNRVEVEGAVEVLFRVRASWKGLRSETTLVVRTAHDGGACGYHFEAHTDYVVYAWYDPQRQRLQTGLCARNCEGDRARAEWDLLGAPKSGPWKAWGSWLVGEPFFTTHAQATSCGAFCFADSSGTLLLGPPGMPGPAGITTVVCKGGRQLRVEFIGRQQQTDPSWRQSAYYFYQQAGTLFRVREGRTEPDETCFLASDSLLAGATPQRLGPAKHSVFASAKQRARFAELRKRAVIHSWPLIGIGADGEIGLIEFARQGPEALASLVLVGRGVVVFNDFPAHSRGDREDLWRVDDQGEISPDGFEVLFALKSPDTYVLGISWGSSEGEVLLLLVTRGGQRFTECATGYRYTAPR